MVGDMECRTPEPPSDSSDICAMLTLFCQDEAANETWH